MESITIEKKVAEIALKMGLSYMCETWPRANVRFDKFRRDYEGRVTDTADNPQTLPACLYVQPVSGAFVYDDAGFVKDSPAALIAFADAMPLDYRGEEAQEIAERLKGIANRFIQEVNKSGFFEPVTGRVSYSIGFDRMDACLCIVSVSLNLTEAIGGCVSE